VRDRSLLFGSATVVAAAAGFGLLGPVARFAYGTGLEPLSFVAWRALFATLIVAVFVAWRLGRRDRFVAPWRLPGRQQAALLTAGITSITLNVAMFAAFERTTVALVLLAFYTYPALVAVVAVWRGVEPLDGVRTAALVLALGGMVLVVAGGLDPSGELRLDFLGIGLALVAALSQTIFVTISRSGYSGISTDQAMGWIMAATMVTCIGLAIAAGSGASLAVPLTSGEALGLSALGGTLAAGIPSILFLRGIRTIGGTRTGILMLFEPVVGVVLAAVLLKEALAPIQLAGGACILAAAVLLQRSRGEPIVASVGGSAQAMHVVAEPATIDARERT
jgi:drug/metabolite transporter (DMT)-like permease